jgi:hypothetical protein
VKRKREKKGQEKEKENPKTKREAVVHCSPSLHAQRRHAAPSSPGYLSAAPSL